eukprot:5463761-Pyramimonas_sp.AAC.1
MFLKCSSNVPQMFLKCSPTRPERVQRCPPQMNAKNLTEYVVLDTEDLGPTSGKWKLMDVQ